MAVPDLPYKATDRLPVLYIARYREVLHRVLTVCIE